MTEKEREELLIRLDERTRNIYRELAEKEDSLKSKIDEILLQQREQNGNIQKCLEDISSHEAKISSHTTSIKLLQWLIGIGIPVIIALIGYFITRIK